MEEKSTKKNHGEAIMEQDFWEAFGRYLKGLGSIWETYGSYLRGILEPFEGHLG